MYIVLTQPRFEFGICGMDIFEKKLLQYVCHCAGLRLRSSVQVDRLLGYDSLGFTQYVLICLSLYVCC